MTQFLAELVTVGLGNDDLDYYRLGRFRQVPLTIAPYAAGEWALVFRLSTFFTWILQSIGMNAVMADDLLLASHGSANFVFAISEVMGFVVEARCPDVDMAPSFLRINIERMLGHKKQKARCW